MSSGPAVAHVGYTGTDTDRDRWLAARLWLKRVDPALSAQLDPANLREVIRSYQSRIATPIQLFDGFLVRYVGDGVLICFG